MIKNELQEAIKGSITIWVITTVYMGASDKRAVDVLQEMGAEVKVSYDNRRKRLPPPKAWLLQRESGFSAGYVGSSNLSASVQTEGLEWNVRLSKPETSHLIEKFEASFGKLLEQRRIKIYEQKEEEQEKLCKALSQEKPSDFDIAFFDIIPYSFQKEILGAFEDIRKGKLYKPREGVYFNKATNCNILFVTFNKSEKEYSPSTMYKDYAISESLFHWQTQSNTGPSTKKGQRHIKASRKRYYSAALC